MPYQYLLLEKKHGVGKIVLNRPEVMNALSPALLVELKQALDEANLDKEIALVVLTGAGRAFSAGVDLTLLSSITVTNGRVGPVLDAPATSVVETIQRIPKIVIAAVNGHCYAGALEIVLACDLIIASEEAKFGDTHVRWGLRPSWGMSWRLPCAVGYAKAKELSFTADVISAREAEHIGLINRVVPAGMLDEAVQELARKIISNSLDAVAAYKQLYNRAIANLSKEYLRLEAESEFPILDSESRIKSFGKIK